MAIRERDYYDGDENEYSDLNNEKKKRQRQRQEDKETDARLHQMHADEELNRVPIEQQLIAEKEGKALFELDKEVTCHPSCPYPIGEPKRKFWFDGFFEAQVKHNVGHILENAVRK